MSAMVEIPSVSRSALFPLFEGNRRDRAIIDCVLEGRHGTAHADDAIAPTVARLDCGPFTALGGDGAAEAAESLVRCARIDWTSPETDEWRALLARVFAGHIRRISFVTFSPASLDVGTLEHLTHSASDGYELRRLDAALAGKLVDDMGKRWLLDCYGSLDDFLRRGIGYAVTHRERVVACATSAVTSSRAIDIDVETVPAHRGKNLATAAGAALALESLLRGLDPLWLASNEASCRLAARLGYTRGDEYETFAIAT